MSRTRLFVVLLGLCACNPKQETDTKKGDDEAEQRPKKDVASPEESAPAPPEEQKTGDARIFTAEGDKVVEGPFSASELNPELEVFGKAVVAELNAESQAGLKALLIEKADYERVFPDVSANRLTTKIGWEYSWNDMTVETEDEITDILKKHGGRDLTYVDIEVTTLVERTNVRLYRKAVLEVRDAGNEKEVRRLGIFGTMVDERESGDLSLLSYRMFRPAAAEGEESNTPPRPE